jgi:peroxiredoxin family protein
MQRLLVLGGGTAGTMVVNKLRRKLDAGWQITVVDADDSHLYQPGFLFVPFGVYQPAEVVRPRHRFMPDGVELVLGEIELVDAETSMATHQMRKQIHEVGVPDVPEFLAQIVDSGGHLWACRMSADMMQLDENDLYDGVEGIISATDFIEKTDGAQLLFI